MKSLGEKAALVALLRDGEREQRQLFAPEVEDQIAAWEAEGIKLVSVLDPDYPENLKAAHDRPPLIFVAGELKAADARSVAVIGSRNASDAGLAAARTIAEHLVERGFTVISGLAAGIDTAAHTAALEKGGRTVAVIGTGLRHTYPPQNAELQRRIARDCAVVSQFWPDDPPSRRSFPLRNGVMSGMTLATVIVEASATSGTRVQARLALGQGRPVLLRDALLDQDWARELAAQPGVRIFRKPEQIVAALLSD